MKKKIYLLVCIVLVSGIVLCVGFVYINPNTDVPSSSVVVRDISTTTYAESIKVSSAPTNKVLGLVGTTTLPSGGIVDAVSQKNEVNFVVMAGSSTYNIVSSEGVTLYDAMVLFSQKSQFRFSARYFSGFGYFVEEINGIKNSDGSYWAMYVNGGYSNIGASQYIPKDGDRVEWRFVSGFNNK